MKILIDTNIFIHREYDRVVPEKLQKLEKTLRTQKHTLIVHPSSKQEIQNDDDKGRRERAESKMETYVELNYPTYPEGDSEFREVIQKGQDFNEKVDNTLLYSVYDGRVDILITEDSGLHKKASKLDLEDQVYTIKQACNFFKEDHGTVSGPLSIEKVMLEELDWQDPIFDSLRKEYDEFVTWFESNPKRDAYVNWIGDDCLGAILIIKPNEKESIGDSPPLEKKKRMKISTLKVAEDRRGSKAGELLIDRAIRESIEYELDEIYLTHFERQNDYLVNLIEEYGFIKSSEKHDGESVFVKRLIPGPNDDPTPMELARQFYPSFYDGDEVDKFLVPIQPQFHHRLFPTYNKRQTYIGEFAGKFISEGNAIKKAYLSHSNTKQIEPEDVLLFYQSHEEKKVTTVGVCETVKYGLTNPNSIFELIRKVSVFSYSEIEKMAESDTTVILFQWHFNLEYPVNYKTLREKNILSGPLQQIQKIDEDDYKTIKQQGGLDERFTFD